MAARIRTKGMNRRIPDSSTTEDSYLFDCGGFTATSSTAESPYLCLGCRRTPASAPMRLYGGIRCARIKETIKDMPPLKETGPAFSKTGPGLASLDFRYAGIVIYDICF